MKVRNAITGLTAVLMMSLLLGACGSDSEDDGVASPSGPPGDPIVVGTICSCTGPAAGDYGGSDELALVWRDAVNAAGGINGHPVKMIVKDDGGDPTKALQLVKELVEQDKVVAIVADTSIVDASWQSYVEEKGVPVVGGLVSTSPFVTSPMFFGTGGGQLSNVYGITKLLKDAGKSKLAELYCQETPQCATTPTIVKKVGEGIGIETVYQGTYSASATDYTAQCLAVKNSGADSLWIAGPITSTTRVAADCDKQGVEVQRTGSGEALSPPALKQPSYDGFIAPAPVFPFFLDDTPELKAYRDAVKAYAPEIEGTDLDNWAGAFNWSAGKLFEAAAKAGNIGPGSTSEDVLAGLYALKGETLGGLAATPITFSKGEPTVFPCFFAVGIEGGEWTAPSGLEAQCGDVKSLVDARNSVINQ